MESISGIIIFVLILIPGVPGESIYNLITGKNWREERFQQVMRIVMFSVIGLCVYSIISYYLMEKLTPRYVIPKFYDMYWSSDDIIVLSYSYLGHVSASSVLGVIASGVRKWAASIMYQTAYPSAWDDLLRTHTEDHWIVVSLENGEAYEGILETADKNVPPQNRDILLREPAKFSSEQENYITLPYQHLFLPAAQISSVAVVYDSEYHREKRITGIGEPVHGHESYE